MRSSDSGFPTQDFISLDVVTHEVAAMATATKNMPALVVNGWLPLHLIADEVPREFCRQLRRATLEFGFLA
ncbi:MAG: hypothetical protein JRE57_00850 [Deltaproteobacteria bacterium]|nr:hypothetical protein [Deltaproteobacteria bacterium]